MKTKILITVERGDVVLYRDRRYIYRGMLFCAADACADALTHLEPLEGSRLATAAEDRGVTVAVLADRRFLEVPNVDPAITTITWEG